MPLLQLAVVVVEAFLLVALEPLELDTAQFCEAALEALLQAVVILVVPAEAVAALLEQVEPMLIGAAVVVAAEEAEELVAEALACMEAMVALHRLALMEKQDSFQVVVVAEPIMEAPAALAALAIV
jgi:hypothetical protein